MFQVYSVCMHASCEMRRAFGHHQNHSKPIAPLCGEKRHDNQNITYGDIKKGQSYNNLLHSKMKLNVVIYTLYITQIMTGAYQALMQGVGIFREIITNSAFLKGKGKSSSHSHVSLFTDTFSLSNSSTGSSLSSSVIVVREMWFALSR